MTRSFRKFTVSEFYSYIAPLAVKRKIGHIQIHHTWKPSKADYRGESTIRSMEDYHINTNGWVEIAQHFSVAPDGTIWDGRTLELDPAGIKGHNKGGLMFELIGNFDKGQDRLEGAQLYAITRAVVICQNRWGLKNADIVFHREIDPIKSCPGTGIERYWFLNMVDLARPLRDMPFADVPDNHWGVNAIKWVSEKGLLTANKEGRFRPDDPVTRAEMAAILHRMAQAGMLK